MNLTGGELYWPVVSRRSELLGGVDALGGDLSCDVLVVGAGITGAFSACLLAEGGLDVVVVDRRPPAEGSTAACTALIQYEIDRPLLDLAAMHSRDKAEQAYRATWKAVDDIASLVRRHGIDCDLRRRASLYLGRTNDEGEFFLNEAGARRALGIEIESLSRAELQDRFQIDRPCALLSQHAMELNPVALTLGLLSRARQMGARIFSPAEIEVRSIDREAEFHQHVFTTAGHRIRCRQLVIAAGYETPEQFKMIRSFCALKSTFAFASERLEQEAWPGDVMMWESGQAYFYARKTPDGRAIVGGEDEPVSDPARRDAVIEAKGRALVEKFAKLRPDVVLRPQFLWAGTFAETADGLPYIGGLPDWPRCHFALGYAGNGVTYSMIAAQLIRDAIVGRENENQRLFGFDR